ncbi:hypothetical protein Vretimale_1808 [Volvox reticuliferus]|nr:hypothetical protein Vretimale_1808 [Volvox reticuliferus]
MVRDGMVVGLDIGRAGIQEAKAGVCAPCVMAKQRQGPYPATGHKAAVPLGLIHLDVCGPMQEVSLGGMRYVTVLLDDCTGLSTVAFTPSKAAVRENVILMINTLERASGHLVKEVRSDRGTEFINAELMAFFSSKGIVHGTTAGYNPEQNGAAERLNRTLLEKARAMLVESKLPKQLWGEAVSTANTLRNVSPVRGQKVTPCEAFYGYKPDVRHLRVFGCAAYVYVPAEKRDKLDPKSQRGVLVGFGQGGQYRVLVDDVVKVCSDVHFDEDDFSHPKLVMDVKDESDDSDEDAKAPDGDGGPSGGGGGPPGAGGRPSGGGGGPSGGGGGPSGADGGSSDDGENPGDEEDAVSDREEVVVQTTERRYPQ